MYSVILVSLVAFLIAGKFAEETTYDGDDDNRLAEYECFRDMTRRCSNPSNLRGAQPFPNAEELEQKCDSLLENARCETVRAEECGEGIGNILNQMKSFYEGLCDADSSLGRTYRAGVDCLNTQIDAVNNCSSHLSKKVRKFFGGCNDEEYFRCREIVVAQKCNEIHFKEVCGEPAAQIVTMPFEIQQQMQPFNESCKEALNTTRYIIDDLIKELI